MKLKKAKKWNPAKSKRKLDKLFSSVILARDKRTCVKCGKTNCKVDTSHCIPREVLSLRWSEKNAVCLCFTDHKLVWHKNPLVGVAWLQAYLGTEACAELVRLSRQPFEFTEEIAQAIEKELKTKIDTLSRS